MYTNIYIYIYIYIHIYYIHHISYITSPEGCGSLRVRGESSTSAWITARSHTAVVCFLFSFVLDRILFWCVGFAEIFRTSVFMRRGLFEWRLDHRSQPHRCCFVLFDDLYFDGGFQLFWCVGPHCFNTGSGSGSDRHCSADTLNVFMRERVFHQRPNHRPQPHRCCFVLL